VVALAEPAGVVAEDAEHVAHVAVAPCPPPVDLGDAQAGGAEAVGDPVEAHHAAS
jgi:hypothetical protein